MVQNLVQNRISRLVPSQTLFGEVLVRFGQALHLKREVKERNYFEIVKAFSWASFSYLGETRVECHGRMIGILGQVQVSSTSELLLDDQSLFQELESTSQELVLDLQEVAFAHVHFEWLIDDGEAHIILNILPTAVTVGDNT